MTETQRLAALQQELAETKRALAEANLRDQRSRAIREEIARRRLPNPAAVEALVDQQIAPLDDGRLVVVDQNGVPVIGSSEGAYKTVSDLLDEISIDWLKSSGAATAHAESSNASNPFAKGEGFNLTRGMQIFRQDEALGRELMSAAGYHMEIRR